MRLKLHTVSRNKLFEAKAFYKDGKVTVLKGSRINLGFSSKFKPTNVVKQAIKNPKLVDKDGILKQDITFESLSTAATFVTGREANGMIVWKTSDGKYVRYTLKKND